MNRIVRDFHREVRRERMRRFWYSAYFYALVILCTAATVRCFVEAMR